MTTPRFLIAKYAPDLQRMEPRNIGLVLWNKGRIAARFLSMNEARFVVTEPDVYQRWIEFWSELISKDVIQAPGQKAVAKNDEQCLDAILSTQDGNYILVDAGFVPTLVPVRDTQKAADYLFGRLVAQPVDTSQDDGQFSMPSFAGWM